MDLLRQYTPVSGKIQVQSLPSDLAPEPSPSGESPAPSSGSGGGNVLVFTPDSPLAAHTTYEVNLGGGIRRTDGEASSTESWTFTTGEPPATAQNQIVFLSPRDRVARMFQTVRGEERNLGVGGRAVPTTRVVRRRRVGTKRCAGRRRVPNAQSQQNIGRARL